MNVINAGTFDETLPEYRRTEDVVRTIMSKLSNERLVSYARLFEEQVQLASMQFHIGNAILDDWPFMALLPSTLEVPDANRNIEPVCSIDHMDLVGRALQNCLSTATGAIRYNMLLSSSTSFLVAIRSTQPNELASAAVLRATKTVANTYRLEVTEHRGKRNAYPTAECRQAIHALLRHCASHTVQCHLSVLLSRGINVRQQRRKTALANAQLAIFREAVSATGIPV